MLNVKALLTKILELINVIETWKTATKDYIVETGTSNSWTYKKYNSGTYDAWRYYQATGLNLNSSSAGTYYGSSKDLTLPSFSTGLTSAVATNAASQSSGVYIYQMAVESGKLRIHYRSHASITNASCGAYVRITGTW